MKNLLSAFPLSFCLSACSVHSNVESNTQYVDPFVGAAEFGHCIPNACFPFGLIQVGPQSGNCSWDYTGGYQYKDTVLYGFSQTRVNGTGCPDLGDLLMLPYTGDMEQKEYASGYQKKNQFAEPGYYMVYLDDYEVNAEMTASPHVAIHRYTFNTNDSARLLIDFQNGMVGDENTFHQYVLNAEQLFESSTRIVGFARTKSWIERCYYYTIEFNRPYKQKHKLPLRDIREQAPRYVLDFDLKKGEELLVKVALSSVSIEGAKRNLETELPGWDFNAVKQVAHKEWHKFLSRINVKGTTEQKRIFYTAMYRLFIQPNNIADTDQPTFYSTLSLWDTYRAAHPLYTIVSPEIVNDFVNSMLKQFDTQGFLPIWALWGGETYTMIGNHAVPVIVDAYLKGFRGFDVEKAYSAIRTSLLTNLPKSNWDVYDQYGYLPFDIIKDESVSRTLESCYDDYCAAQLAKALGKEDDYRFFTKRAGYYKNLFDREAGLMRPKDSKGNWRTPFDKLVISHESTSGGDYTEGNAWQYTWHVQHEPDSLINMLGGEDAFITKLDSLFILKEVVHNEGFSSDVTGLIGQYAHGNEPSHHVAYLYRMAGKPSKTEELVNYICKTKYLDRVDGLCGNDDCGQMSAWYVFSAMGFYPVNPCGGEYILGAPQLPRITIELGNNKRFVVETVNYSLENIHVRKIELNGKELTGNSISHKDIMEGGILKFYMMK